MLLCVLSGSETASGITILTVSPVSSVICAWNSPTCMLCIPVSSKASESDIMLGRRLRQESLKAPGNMVMLAPPSYSTVMSCGDSGMSWLGYTPCGFRSSSVIVWTRDVALEVVTHAVFAGVSVVRWIESDVFRICLCMCVGCWRFRWWGLW